MPFPAQIRHALNAQRLPTTVISMGWTGSSKPSGKNGTELQLPQLSQSSLLFQSRVHFRKQPLVLAHLYLFISKAKPGALFPSSQPQALHLHSSLKANSKKSPISVLEARKVTSKHSCRPPANKSPINVTFPAPVLQRETRNPQSCWEKHRIEAQLSSHFFNSIG